MFWHKLGKAGSLLSFPIKIPILPLHTNLDKLKDNLVFVLDVAKCINGV